MGEIARGVWQVFEGQLTRADDLAKVATGERDNISNKQAGNEC